MERAYHYYAFISYSTKDSKWAKWLQHHLSYYHIPSSVRKSKIGVPQKLRPIFIYEYDLTGNQLHKSIKEELADSKYLIVLCSPSAAQSTYVNEEVLEFIRTGREDFIIPFIVEGEVNSTDHAQECFPSGLRELLKSKELRGENVALNGKYQALVGVVATMLGVRRDLLWNRYKVRILKQRISLAIVAFFAILIGLLYWDYTRPTYEYFADYVDVWGVPEGVHKLNKMQVKHRNKSYRFEYRRIPLGQPEAYSWRLAKISHVNSAGTSIPIGESAYIDRYPIQKLTYDQNNGILTDITYYNELEQPQLIHNLSRNGDTAAAIVDIESVVAGEGVAFSKSITAEGSDNVGKTSDITRYVYERNDAGYITKVTFHANNSRDFNSSATPDNSGVWGMAYELDSLGRRVIIRYLNKDGSYHCNKIGVLERHYEYNPIGNICSEHIFDLHGKLILNEFLCSVAMRVYDNFGNEIECVYYGIDGDPCLHNAGYAKWTAKYDDRGNMVEVSFYGTDGEPCLSGEGCAKWTAKYDDRGNKVEVSFYGTDGEPCLSTYDYAKCTSKYDDRGNRVEISCYGIEGEPCLSSEGWAKWTSKYDDRGNRVEVSFYDIDGEPCLSGEGSAKWTAKYDDRGNKVEVSFYGTDGEPCLNTYDYAKCTSKYDDRGNMVEVSFYGTDGEPYLSGDGCAKWTAKYDDRGNKVEVSFYGTDGEPCLSGEGWAKWTSKYDDRGNEIECVYYGIDGEPCLNSNGYAKSTSKYDDRGNEIERVYYGIDGEPCLINYGCAKWTAKYDDRGNREEISCYGIDGEPCLNSNDYAKSTSKYDDRGNGVEVSFYGADGEPCLSTYGYAKCTSKYDDRGNEVEVSFYGADGEPCLHYDGYAKCTSKYDDRGNRVEVSYYSIDGEPCLINYGCAKWTSKYDERGYEIENAYYGIDGELCLNSNGCAKSTSKYDDHGNMVEVSFYGTDGEPCSNNEGCAKWTSKYDDRGNRVEISCYGIEGEPCLNIGGYSIEITNYNDKCQVIERSYYDTERKPINVRGYFREVRIYDKNNNQKESVYYDCEGKMLAEQIFTVQMLYIGGAALAQGMPRGSIMLQYNEWRIGDSHALLSQIDKRSMYGEKDIYYLTPEGKFGHIYVKGGLLGTSSRIFMVEKSKSQEWLNQLDEWRKTVN